MKPHSQGFGRQMPPQGPARHGPPPNIQMAAGAPPGTFSPGTKIQVGSHRVIIQKYLSEGGFAHVYVVKLPKPINGTDVAVLKRVAVPDKESLRGMRIEVETMKRLKGHRAIVTYIDSHASELKNGGYEVFLLMEFCNGGGLIDFMNTRLQHRLTEPEIIQIFTDIAEGVACMHYLKPALLHRDLKVENVLISAKGANKRFKLCDFGSAAAPRPAPATVAECRAMDEDVQKHTTLQYRSPEMIDVYRKQPINEKSDIWALGVLLYKLCYYTTPFEEQGQLAILNASFRYPSHPIFSDRLKKLIGSMLREKLESRPNIYQVLKEASAMAGREMPIPDIYPGKAPSSQVPPQKQKPLPSQPTVGAVVSTPVKEVQQIPDIIPMRRGRPQATPSRVETPSKPVTSGDPFAALDIKSKSAADIDDTSSRFPSLDQFSLLHDKSSNFNFDSVKSPPMKPAKDMNDRMAEKLADAAFANSRQSTPVQNETIPSKPTPAPVPKHTNSSTPQTHSSAMAHRPQPSIGNDVRSTAPAPRPISISSRYVSTGTMTSDVPPSGPKNSSAEVRPITPVLSDNSSYRKRPVSVAVQRPSSNDTTEQASQLSNQNEAPEWKPEPKKLSDGQFGDRFKHFENNSSSEPATQLAKTMQRDLIMLDDGPREIIGLDEDSSDDDLSPEMRREMERLQLEDEERRVEAAQLEYRNRTMGGATTAKPTPGPKSVTVAKSTIQNRVHALLSDDQRQAPIQRTAEGYGKYSDAATAASKPQKTPPEVRRKPLLSGVQRTNTLPQAKPAVAAPSSHGTGTVSAPPTAPLNKAPSKPPAPKKPVHLNSLPTGTGKPLPGPKPAREHLIAVDLPGQPVIEMTSEQKEDYLEDFSKRFPSLSAMESSNP
ncbi:Putative Serine/threonine-protein kinase ppk30 [[Torrubiella] hemipterigena]|uniref:non-specific serine/threonine protein kinase n=1 Tax=[Torrubiella] hemipterigena TaxID=1531966 RepID=A0A0A1T5X4_9HYPO|nr:Putative Serine/threonine-protein kinase ppk30 [[Torrubiella] hemipterigena]